MPVFFLIIGAMGLGNVAWWRWADARVRRQPHARGWRALLALFIGIQLAYLAYFILAPQSARRVHAWLPIPLMALVYMWSLIVLPVSLLSIGGAKAVGRALALLKPKAQGAIAESSDSTFTRRQALTAVAVAAPPIVAMLAVARAMPRLEHFRIRALDVVLPGLPPNLDGLRIVHLSDTHIGRYTRRGTLPGIIEATNKLKADLILFTGDLIDLSIRDLDRGIDTMRQLDPRHGLAMIEGNHDLIDSAEAFDRRTKAAGLPLLVDESMTIPIRGERVQILGMRWGTATADRRRQAGEDSFRQSLDRLLPQRQEGAFPIVLAHHPHAFDTAAAAGLPLMLSGHTHGGQLMLAEHLGFGPLFFRYWSGLYRKGQSQLVVSNGVGNWFPLRVNAPAEIIHLTLRSG